MANSYDLPQETLLEIFTYLPTKSVGKFKCLSKTWNTNLSTSYFTKLHQKQKPCQQKLLILSQSGFLRITLINNINLSPSITQLGDEWTKMLGSCNGLVLLQKRLFNKMMFVVNPVTRQQVQIPNPPSDLLDNGIDVLYGFGYDISSDDYKVVKITAKYNAYADMTDGYHMVEVCCMKTRIWKNAGHSPFEFQYYSEKAMPFVNGAVHWFTAFKSGSGDQIAKFDLATESFHKIPLPKERGRKNTCKGFGVHRGCLAIIDLSDVWVMKEYGVVDSWVRFRIHENVMWKRVRHLCFIDDEEILCFTDTGHWFVYELNEGVEKDVVGVQISTDRFSGWTVVEESLISPY